MTSPEKMVGHALDMANQLPVMGGKPLAVLSYAELPEDLNLRVNRSVTVQARQNAA